MNQIISQIEACSEKLVELETKYGAKVSESGTTVNLLWWKWHERRAGMIRACELMGLRVEAKDTKGLKWGIADCQ